MALHELGRNEDALAIYERVAQEALFRAEDRARYAALLAANNRLDEARAQMERALEQDPESELVQRLAAEMALGIGEFVPFPQPFSLESIQAADVLRAEAEHQPRNLRPRVCAELLADPSLTPEVRRDRVREFGRGLCPPPSGSGCESFFRLRFPPCACSPDTLTQPLPQACQFIVLQIPSKPSE